MGRHTLLVRFRSILCRTVRKTRQAQQQARLTMHVAAVDAEVFEVLHRYAILAPHRWQCACTPWFGVGGVHGVEFEVCSPAACSLVKHKL